MFFQSKKTPTLGELGENLAIKYLQNKNYKIIEKNFKNPSGRRLGEIDIIAAEKKSLVFIEVKTRVSKNYLILPEENITKSKLFKLSKIIQFYISSHDLWEVSYRIDAISIIIDQNTKKAQIKHLKNIFS